MDRTSSEVPLLLLIVGTIALIFSLFVGGFMLMSRSMMGGMMGGTGVGNSAFDAVVLAVAIVIAAIAFGLAFMGRRSTPIAGRYPPVPPRPDSAVPIPQASPQATTDAQVLRFQEAAVVKALDADERQLYVRIREAGGAALQRDIVASGVFSKAKVTRVLDKLERKGLVVRERYGATNRVRLTWKGPPTS